MKILHVFNDQKKFSKGFFRFLKENNFDMSEMRLVHYGIEDTFYTTEIGIDNYFIPHFWSIVGNIKLLCSLCKADKIVVHSLAAPALLFYFTLFRSLQEKTVWIIWGKDFYFYHLLKKKRLYHEIYEWFHKHSIQYIGTIVTSIKEDYDKLKEWYSVSGKHIECNCLYYYSVNHKVEEIKEIDADWDNKFTILLGNSGSETNNHYEALNLLLPWKKQIKKIYCPLSYGGNKKYRQAVSKMGKEMYKDKFVPLMEFMNLSEYDKIISSIDIGIFNHDRQEGLANVWSLIFKGKTIYLKEGISSYKFFKRNGIEVKSIQSIDKEGMKRLNYDELTKNQKILSDLLDKEKSVKCWMKILYD